MWLGGQAFLMFYGDSSEFLFGREAVSSAVWCCVQVGFGGISKALVCTRNSPLFVVWSFMFRDGCKYGGVLWELAIPETTREVPASEATRRTSPSCDYR